MQDENRDFLLERLQQGDEQAFRMLFEEFYASLCLFAARYLRDRETGNFLIVPDKQMNDFMFLLDFSKEMVEVVNENLKKGDKVRVIKGDFAGIEGELIRVKGHKRVVVRLEGVVSLATAYIPGSFLEKIE